MSRDPDDTTRMVLAVILTVALACFVITLLVHKPPEGNLVAATEGIGTFVTAVGLVVNYYFRKR
jgi:hypothetical protein